MIELTPKIKLTIGLLCGIIVYLLFRWFIHIINKTAKEINAKPNKKRKSIDYLKEMAGQKWGESLRPAL